MDALQISAILSSRMNTAHVHSALPNAPIVGDGESAWYRGRASLAGLLRRAADAVAPAVSRPACGLRLPVGRAAD